MAMISINSHASQLNTVQALFRNVKLALGVRKQRKALAALETERLVDLGLSHDSARRESSRPIWDVPSHWQR